MRSTTIRIRKRQVIPRTLPTTMDVSEWPPPPLAFGSDVTVPLEVGSASGIAVLDGGTVIRDPLEIKLGDPMGACVEVLSSLRVKVQVK
jgi:hypothetical protein